MIFGIEISSPEFTLSQKKGPLKLSGAKIGDLIRARVLDLLPDGRANLLVSGRKVIAKTDLPMLKGDTLMLEVTREGERLSLKPAAQSSPTVQPQAQGGRNLALAALFAKAVMHLESLGKTEAPGVKNILDTLALKSGQRDDGLLPRLIENLGLTLEKKIAATVVSKEPSTPGNNLPNHMGQLLKTDLKAAVLHLLSTESDGPASKALKGVATTLESFQQLNTQAGDGNRFLLPFPVAVPGSFDFGQLFINTGEKSGGKDKKDRIIDVAILMNMTALGTLRADFSFFKKRVTGGFLLENQEICDYMAALMPELEARLASIGFTAGNIGCKVAPEVTVFSPGDLVKSMVAADHDSTRTLDLVI